MITLKSKINPDAVYQFMNESEVEAWFVKTGFNKHHFTKTTTYAKVHLNLSASDNMVEIPMEDKED